MLTDQEMITKIITASLASCGCELITITYYYQIIEKYLKEYNVCISDDEFF